MNQMFHEVGIGEPRMASVRPILPPGISDKNCRVTVEGAEPHCHNGMQSSNSIAGCENPWTSRTKECLRPVDTEDWVPSVAHRRDYVAHRWRWFSGSLVSLQGCGRLPGQSLLVCLTQVLFRLSC